MAWEKTQMWVTPKFKKFMYERKAQDFKKTLFDIQEDIMQEVGYKEMKEEKMFKAPNKKGNKFGGSFFGKL